MGIVFEWDEEKAARNRRKHGVTFGEASTVFGDLLSLTIPDPPRRGAIRHAGGVGARTIISCITLQQRRRGTDY
jgi:uncharacterized DUF497 family protein